MPTHYTKLAPFLVFLLLSGCSQTLKQDNDFTEESSANQQPTTGNNIDKDLQNYKVALFAMRDKKLNIAKPLLLEITENHPEFAGPYANLGIIYYRQGDLKKALISLRIAIKRNPKNAYAHNTIASVFQTKGDFSLAEKHFLLAINNKRDYAIAHYNIALLYDIFFHRIKDSISHYRKYLSIIQKQGSADKKTTDWLEQLENSLKQG